MMSISTEIEDGTPRRFELQGWEFDVLLLASLTAGILLMTAISFVGGSLGFPPVVQLSIGVAGLFLALYPILRVYRRGQGGALPVLKYLAFTLIGAAVGAGVFLLFDWF